MTVKTMIAVMASVIMLCSVNATAKKHNSSIYKEYRHGHNMIHMSLAAWLAKPTLMGKYNKEARKALNHVKKVKILVYDGAAPAASLQESMAQSFSSKNFKDLMSVNDGRDKVEFKIRQDGKYIRELAMVVKDDSSLVAIFFEGKLSLKDARDFAANIRK